MKQALMTLAVAAAATACALALTVVPLPEADATLVRASGAPERDIPGGRRRGAAFRRCELRCRAVDIRCDVLARPGARGVRAGAGVPPRRADRSGQLDARQSGRPDVQGAGAPDSSSGWRAAAGALGRRDAPALAVRGQGRRDSRDATAVQLPLPLGRA